MDWNDKDISDRNDFVEFAEILRTYNQGDIALLKSLLDNNEIVYFFKGENFISLRPLVEPAVLMAKNDQIQETVELLKDFELSFLGLSIENTNDIKEEIEKSSEDE
ncbi:MAG: hypothetical protein PHR06_04475 [Candidatus Cloacimonetes bacterium]|nr:hypothetical protein [Candidatus Cloacimonadota bacterium]